MWAMRRGVKQLNMLMGLTGLSPYSGIRTADIVVRYYSSSRPLSYRN